MTTFRPGERVQWRGEFAEVMEDLGDRVRVWGFVRINGEDRGPYMQVWIKDVNGERVRRVT